MYSIKESLPSNLEQFFDGRNQLCVSTEILVEYEEILERLTDLETANMVIEL